MKIDRSTWLWLAAALGAVALVHVGGGQADDGIGFVSTKSAARRVFPVLSDVGPEGVTVQLEATGGAQVVIAPGVDGHVVEVDGEVIGPADPDAVDGLVDSLRIATTLRAVSGDAQPPAARRGRIEVRLPSVSTSVVVGGETPDGAGLYGILGEEGGEEGWVVETDLGEILDQEPTAWIARRAVVVEPGQVTRVAFDGAQVERGIDGLWRSRVGEEIALLSTEAVEARIGRMVTARLDPLLPPDPSASSRPWVTLEAVADRSWTLELLGPCPGAASRELLRRGRGWTGCIDEAVTTAWPLPGAAQGPAGAMVEPRLVPYGYGQILRFETPSPTPRILRRQVGDWVIEQRRDGQATVTSVDGAAVFDWFTSLHEAEVEVDTDASAAALGPPSAALQVHTDSTRVLDLRCWDGDPVRCRRDQGPILRVLDRLPALSIDATSFADRRLLAFSTEDARAVEILPGPGGDGVRQSVHFDLGVWRLDAPSHPDGDEALAETALEEVLGALASARADAWLDRAPGPALREIRVERTPRRDQPAELALVVYADCVVETGGRFARVGAHTCEALSTPLLHPDPVDYWVRTARSIEVREHGGTARFKRDGEALRPVEGTPDVARAQARLDALAAARVTAIVRAPRPADAIGTLRILPSAGAAFELRYGEGWAALDGADWAYRFAASPANAPD